MSDKIYVKHQLAGGSFQQPYNYQVPTPLRTPAIKNQTYRHPTITQVPQTYIASGRTTARYPFTYPFTTQGTTQQPNTYNIQTSAQGNTRGNTRISAQETTPAIGNSRVIGNTRAPIDAQGTTITRYPYIQPLIGNTQANAQQPNTYEYRSPFTYDIQSPTQYSIQTSVNAQSPSIVDYSYQTSLQQPTITRYPFTYPYDVQTATQGTTRYPFAYPFTGSSTTPVIKVDNYNIDDQIHVPDETGSATTSNDPILSTLTATTLVGSPQTRGDGIYFRLRRVLPNSSGYTSSNDYLVLEAVKDSAQHTKTGISVTVANREASGPPTGHTGQTVVQNYSSTATNNNYTEIARFGCPVSEGVITEFEVTLTPDAVTTHNVTVGTLTNSALSGCSLSFDTTTNSNNFTTYAFSNSNTSHYNDCLNMKVYGSSLISPNSQGFGILTTYTSTGTASSNSSAYTVENYRGIDILVTLKKTGRGTHITQYPIKLNFKYIASHITGGGGGGGGGLPFPSTPSFPTFDPFSDPFHPFNLPLVQQSVEPLEQRLAQ